MKYHGIKPVYNVWLSKDDGKYFGPGVAMLIEGVKRTGSLSSKVGFSKSAAKEIGMAYSKAWRIIKRSEELTGCKLLLSRTGGAHGGGACLTQDAEQILSDFTAFRKEVDTEIEKAFKKYFAN